MGRRGGFRVFVSAVTPELGSYRREVARVLRRKGLEVRDQEHFHQGGATLLEKLREYIESCDAVIFLIGERCGAMATPEHAAALGGITGFQKYSSHTAQKEASYTQWEFFLAKQHGKKTYTFFTAAGFVPNEANSESDERKAAQQAYRGWIDRTGEHRDTLRTAAKLIEDVLVLPFPDLGRPKPINLPYASIGTLFKGREAFMAQMRTSLEDAGSRASAIVGKTVHGLGGVGKTRLAVEYAWQNADHYNALLFVVAGSAEDLRRNLAALVGPMVLDLDEQDAKEDEVKVAAALRWLQHNKGWFLILDNVDTREAAEAAEKLLAQLTGGDVLITSRLSRWSRQVEPLELDVLAADDAVAFLLERTDRRRRKTPTDKADARTLATELGELALALEQAGAYIEEQRLTFGLYLTEWQASRDKVAAWFDPQVMQYPRSLAVTWQTSVAQLSEPARRLLERLAWLAPDPIPETLLDVAVPGDEKAVEEARAALANLERYSLVTRARDAPTFTVHRLVQDVTRRSLNSDAAHTVLVQVLGWINAAFVADPGDVRAWPVSEPLAPHVAQLSRYADNAGVGAPTAELLNKLGMFWRTRALFGDAEALFRRARKLAERTGDQLYAAICLNLAGLLQETNRVKEAEQLYHRSLTAAEHAVGREHPIISLALNNFAELLRETGRSQEAELLLRRALEISESKLGPEDPEVARALNNLSLLLDSEGRLDEAEPLYRRSLAIAERAYGTDDPRVAAVLNNLSLLLSRTNRALESEPLLLRALAILENHYGPHHPRVAPSLSNLAALWQATNRHCEAEPLFRRSLEIDEIIYGDKHPEVATDLNNLAGLLLETNRPADAEPLFRRALIVFLSSARGSGHEHPSLRVVLNNYKRVLQAKGKSEAEIDAEIEELMRESGI